MQFAAIKTASTGTACTIVNVLLIICLVDVHVTIQWLGTVITVYVLLQ